MTHPGRDTDQVAVDDWDSHWAEYGETARSNPAQAYRRRLVLDHLALQAGDRLVDIGSGQGDLAADLLAAHPDIDVVGLELGASGIAQARVKAPAARFVQTDLLQPQDVPEDLQGWGTAAVCSEVLEHIEAPHVLLANALPYLATGARVVVTVPGGPRSAFDKHIGHRRHYNARDLAAVIERAGLRVERVDRAGFPFFNAYRLAVVARGERLIEEAQSATDMDASGASTVLRVFDRLFRANLPSSPGGWQMVAVATVPPSR